MNTMTVTTEGRTTLREAGTAVHAAEDELRGAATELALAIIEAAPLGLDLPRGYRVVMGSAEEATEERFLEHSDLEQLCGGGEFLVNGRDIYEGWTDEDEGPEPSYGSGAVLVMCAPDYEELLHFVEDVRGGLLSEIAEVLQEHAARVLDSARTLRAAAAAMTPASN